MYAHVMPENGLEDRIAGFRRFNRFYTKQIGLLRPNYLKSPFSLTQARMLFELAQRAETTARDLIRELEIDPGYASRILTSFEKEGLIKKLPPSGDGRQRPVRMTAKGKKAFSALDRRSSEEAKEFLEKLNTGDQQKLLSAMTTIEDLLVPESKRCDPYIIRSYAAGDAGWITERHGAIYAQEYGWDETFEGLVAEILARFLKEHDAEREEIWIAEQNGERLGSVMLVDAGKQTAQLRLLLVEPKARGKGLGNRLVRECIEFAKRKRYRKMKLWTQSNLLDARRLYERFGFQIIEEKPHHSFGHDLVAEVWELDF